jgi:hypothetical protein
MSFDAAFIGYQNRVTSATLSAVGVTSGYSVNSLKNWQPFEFVSFDAGSNSITIDCGSAASVVVSVQVLILLSAPVPLWRACAEQDEPATIRTVGFVVDVPGNVPVP